MTFLILIAVLGSWGTNTVSGEWNSLGSNLESAPEVQLLEANLQEATIQIEIPGYGVEKIMRYTRFDVPEYGWNLDHQVGTPELPFIPVVVGLPAGMNATVEMVASDWVSAGSGTPYPVQPLEYEGTRESNSFTDLRTDLQGTYPGVEAALGEQGTWTGVNTAVVQFYPFKWDSGTGEFYVARTMTARVVFTGSGGSQAALRPEIAAMHSSRIVNYESLQIPVNSLPVSSDDIVYVCIVPPDNLDAITPFLATVNSLGHHVHVIEMAEGSTSYAIKAAINEVYQPGITRFALIPARHQQLESKSYGSFVGDFYYECLDANNLPDIAVGRFPGNYTQLENQASKVLSYISYTGVPGEPSLPASVILAAHEEDYPGKYTANSEAVKNYNYALADPVFETCYPPEGGTAEQVSTAIDNGVGIVNYRGHGSNTVWQWSPGWNAGSIYGLENTYFPPVFNICCSNGNHSEVYNCLSESWLDGPGVGASGNIGASTGSLTTVNNRMQKVLFWELFDEGNTCAGEMFAASQTDIIQTQGGGGLNNARMYHWFGDPSMDICNSDEPGAPFPLAADPPEALNTGENNLTLTITSGSSPVQGAIVTVTDGIGNHPAYTETFYVQDITDSSGQVTLSFTAVEGKDLFYGVRKHNYGSITGSIEVTTQGIGGGELQGLHLLPVTPCPAITAANVSFQAPAGAFVDVRVMDITGRTTTILHHQNAPGGVFSMDMDTSEMNPGIYFVVFQSEGFTATERMAIVR